VTTLTLTGGISVISEADGIPSFVRRHWHVLIQFVPRKYVNPRAVQKIAQQLHARLTDAAARVEQP
jgi:hypothetical protein